MSGLPVDHRLLNPPADWGSDLDLKDNVGAMLVRAVAVIRVAGRAALSYDDAETGRPIARADIELALYAAELEILDAEEVLRCWADAKRRRPRAPSSE